MSLAECCAKGFNWNLQPKGTVTKYTDHNVYIAGTNKDRAILFVHDGGGWESENSRVLADVLADEVDATVYLPDFFDGKPIAPPKRLRVNPEITQDDIAAFMKHNPRPVREPQIVAVARALRSQYDRVGAVGYCWGGWACALLGSSHLKLVDCFSVAHPSLLTTEDIDAVAVPVQIHAPEHDPVYTAELKAYSNEKIPTLGVPYEYLYYPGLAHGFASRGDPEDVPSQKGMVRAKDATVGFLRNYLVLS